MKGEQGKLLKTDQKGDGKMCNFHLDQHNFYTEASKEGEQHLQQTVLTTKAFFTTLNWQGLLT